MLYDMTNRTQKTRPTQHPMKKSCKTLSWIYGRFILEGSDCMLYSQVALDAHTDTQVSDAGQVPGLIILRKFRKSNQPTTSVSLFFTLLSLSSTCIPADLRLYSPEIHFWSYIKLILVITDS